MAITFEKSDCFGSDIKQTVEGNWISCPLPSIVSFIGTLVSQIFCVSPNFITKTVFLQSEKVNQSEKSHQNVLKSMPKYRSGPQASHHASHYGKHPCMGKI